MSKIFCSPPGAIAAARTTIAGAEGWTLRAKGATRYWLSEWNLTLEVALSPAQRLLHLRSVCHFKERVRFGWQLHGENVVNQGVGGCKGECLPLHRADCELVLRPCLYPLVNDGGDKDVDAAIVLDIGYGFNLLNLHDGFLCNIQLIALSDSV